MTMLPSCDLKKCYSGPDQREKISVKMSTQGESFEVILHFCTKDHKIDGYNMIKDQFAEFP